MQKKVLSLATLTLLLFSILSSLHLNSICPVRAAPENIRVYIDPTTLQDVSLGPGDQFSIDIRTDYVENLWAYQFWLSFNPEVLQGVSVENGPFLDSAGGEVVVIPGPGFDNEVGELKLFGACIFFVGPPPADSQLADGGGILARVTFEVASYGSSPISLGAPETALSNKTGGYELRNNQTGEWEYCYGQRRSNVPPFYPMEPYLPWIESLGHGYFSNEGAYPTPPSFVQDNKLVFESSATYQWLDPHVSYYQYDYWTLWHSVEMLLWYERDNATKIIPWLAEDYTVSGDGKSYNFTLRQGITFQDGTPFNATAVWFSLNRLLIIDGTSGDGINHGTQAAWIVQQLLNASLSSAFWWGQAYDAAWVQAVLDQNFVEILDDYTVRLNLFTPTTQFLPIMAGPWAAIISPTSTIKVDYEHGGWGTWDGNYITYFEHMAGNGDTGLNLPENGWKVGTGAYYVESVSPTTYKIELKAYDDYWGGPNDMNLPPAGKDRIETIEYIYQPSFATRLLDLKAGTATGIQVPTANMFQVIDRDKWIDEGILESIVEGATTHGVFPQLFTWWLCFNTNVTNPDGTLKSWQPFADWRIRMAAASAVNMTYMNIHVNNRSAVVANNIIPPGTVPEGSYNPNVKPAFSFDLTRARELLLDARDDPMNPTYYSNTYYNGTPIPAGVVDNSFGPDFAHAKPVEFYVQTGATAFQEILTTISDNLNAICMEEDLGIRFYVVIVPGGQQYMLASMHLIDSYVGGWICDYNHVLNWLAPMYRSTGTYFSWNLWNITRLDALYDEAVTADQAGDITTLLEINDEMNTIANQMLTYMVWWHPGAFYTRSTWLKGWYVNMAYGVDLGSSMYYEIPVEVVEATIDIAPDLLNLKSKGKRITYYIELPEGYDVGDVNVSTILLNDTIPVGPEAPTQIGDYDSDDVPDLMVKFSRAMVLELILSERITNGYVTLTITGEVDGTPFRGEDTIRVLMTGGGTRGHK